MHVKKWRSVPSPGPMLIYRDSGDFSEAHSRALTSVQDAGLLVRRVYLILRSRVEQIIPEFDLRVYASDAFAG
jgi:hypothetical protein